MKKGVVIYGDGGKAGTYFEFLQVKANAEKINSLENIHPEHIYFGPKVELNQIQNYISKLKSESEEEPFMSLIVYEKDLERIIFAALNGWKKAGAVPSPENISIYNSEKMQNEIDLTNQDALEYLHKHLEGKN